MKIVNEKTLTCLLVALFLVSSPQQSYGQSWLKKISQGIDKGFEAVNKGLENVNKALGGSSSGKSQTGSSTGNTDAQRNNVAQPSGGESTFPVTLQGSTNVDARNPNVNMVMQSCQRNGNDVHVTYLATNMNSDDIRVSILASRLDERWTIAYDANGKKHRMDFIYNDNRFNTRISEFVDITLPHGITAPILMIIKDVDTSIKKMSRISIAFNRYMYSLDNVPIMEQPTAAPQDQTQSHAGNQSSTQGMLNNLQFEIPQCIIHPKSETANIRKQPSTSATIAKKLNRIGSNIVTQMIAAKDYNAQWYQVDGGYAAKSAFAESKKNPLTKDMFLPNFYGYMEDMDCHLEWFIADKVGAHNLALMFVGDRCEFASGGLYLGKRIGDVIVFRYRIPYFFYDYQKDVDPNLFNLVKEVDNEGDVMKTLVVGKNFMIKGVYDEGLRDYYYRLNLYKFNDQIIENFFGEVISKGPNVEFCITSESFPNDCKNVFNF